MLFNIWPDRSRHNYKVIKDSNNTEMLYDKPVELFINETGRCGKLVGGTPVPVHSKDNAASLEWRRAKQQFDKTFTCALKVGAYVDLYHDNDLTGRWGDRHERPDEEFVKAVRDCDPEAMVRFMLPYIYKRSTPECLIAEYKRLYARRRRDILVAAGARIKT